MGRVGPDVGECLLEVAGALEHDGSKSCLTASQPGDFQKVVQPL
jgi:hypothetical protein